MLSAFIVLLFTFFVLLLFWYTNHKRKYGCVEHIPGPAPLPLLGNILELGGNSVDQLRKLKNMKDKYGPIYKLWIGPNQLIIIVSDPEMTETVLSSPKFIYRKFGYDMFYPWLGQSISTSNGALWHKQRKLLTPAFHFQILEQFLPIFNASGNILVQKLSERISDSVDLHSIITLGTLDIICESAMGTSVNVIDDPNNEYVKAVDTICAVTIERFFEFWKRYDILFQFSSSCNKYKDALEVSHKFVRSVIKKRREEIMKTGLEDKSNITEDNFGVKKKIAFLDLLLQSTIDGEPLTDDEIEAQVNTFMFAGHDTISTTLLFSLYFIAKHPHVQNRVLEEIQMIFGSDQSNNITLENLNGMKYTECVIKESLRVIATVPYFTRELEEDFFYKGTVYPKGTVLFFFIYGLHRDEKLFEDAETFNPDRFLCENMNRENYFSFIPFSAGPRNCLGQRFAMYEMKTLLIKIVNSFEISLVEPEKPMVITAEIVAKPTEPIFFNLNKRLS